jgi:uncharacterized membrane protein YccC
LQHVRAFFRVPPSKNDHYPAIRIALGVGLPLIVLLAVGRMDLMLFAALAAFTGVYGRGEPHRPRFDQQWRAGALLLATIAAGTLTSRFDLPALAIVGCTAAVGGLGFVASSLGRLKPAGSLFYVFAYSATAFTAAPASFPLTMAVAFATVALSLVIGVAGRILPGHKTPWMSQSPTSLGREERRGVYAEACLHFAAVGIAGVIAVGIGLGHSYWAMIASSVPLVGVTAGHRVARGVHRILGTFSGLVIAGFLLAVDFEGWQFCLVIIGLQFLVEVFVTRHYALAQTFVTPLALLMIETAHPASPWSLIRDRGVETLVGVTTGIVLVALLHAFRAWPRTPESPSIAQSARVARIGIREH